MSSSGKKGGGSGTVGGGRKSSALPKPKHEPGQGISGDPGPATRRRRTGTPEPLRGATPPPRADTPMPHTNLLEDMEDQMWRFYSAEERAEKQKSRDERKEMTAISDRAPSMTKSITEVGRVDDTNRSVDSQPKVSGERRFLPPRDLADLRLQPANPSAGFGPSTERGPLFGNNEDFVLVTEYLLYWEDPHDVGEVC